MSDIEIKGNDLFETCRFHFGAGAPQYSKSVNSNMVIAYWLIGREMWRISSVVRRGQNTGNRSLTVIKTD